MFDSWRTELWFWLGIHRVAITMVVGIGIWLTTLIWYFSHDLEKYITARQPRRWQIDMASGIVKRQGTGKKRTDIRFE